MNEFVTVLSAELVRRLQSRAFRIGLIVGMAAVALIIKLPAVIGGALTQQAHEIVLAGPADLTGPARALLAKDFEIQSVTPDTAPASIAYLDAHAKAGAKVVLRHGPRGLAVTVYARNLSSVKHDTLRSDLTPLNLALGTKLDAAAIARYRDVPLNVVGIDTKFGSEQASDSAQAIAYTLLIFLYISILMNSQLLMTSVAEEKTSRIAELLIASVNPSALLAGKIAAAAVLGIVQMASWLVIGYLLSPHGGAQPDTGASAGHNAGQGFSAMLAGGVTPVDIVAFAAFFIIGYLQLSTLFAAFASMINRTEDLGSVSGPLIMPVVGAFFIAIFGLGFPNSPVVVVSSFVPIVAPFTMFARIAVSVVPLWQIAISLAINLAAIWAIAILAGKIYRVGMMLYGRPPKFTQILATLRS